MHGLGYDAFRDADEFRQHKQQKLQKQQQQQARRGANGASAAAGVKRARGVAFGTGALEDTDTLGYMEDYVQVGDMADMRLPKGVAREALAYEEHSESGGQCLRANRQQILMLHGKCKQEQTWRCITVVWWSRVHYAAP